jgi:uncharacterized membrane protein
MGRKRRAKQKRALERAQEREIHVAQFYAAQLSYWSGPTPSPEVLRQYEEILPGAADRIISMAERQSEHRQQLETTALGNGHERALFGAKLGFTLGAMAIAGGLWLATHGQELGGYAVMLATVTGLAGVFVYGRSSTKKELAEKVGGPRAPESAETAVVPAGP